MNKLFILLSTVLGVSSTAYGQTGYTNYLDRAHRDPLARKQMSSASEKPEPHVLDCALEIYDVWGDMLMGHTLPAFKFSTDRLDGRFNKVIRMKDGDNNYQVMTAGRRLNVYLVPENTEEELEDADQSQTTYARWVYVAGINVDDAINRLKKNPKAIAVCGDPGMNDPEFSGREICCGPRFKPEE